MSVMADLHGDQILILQPKGPMSKDQAIELAARLIILAGDHDLSQVEAAVTEGKTAHARRHWKGQNVETIRSQGWEFNSHHDHWVKNVTDRKGNSKNIFFPGSRLAEIDPDHCEDALKKHEADEKKK